MSHGEPSGTSARGPGRPTPTLTWAVGLAVVVLLTLFAVVDGDRPWRRLQVEFLRLEADHLARLRDTELDRRSGRLAELEDRSGRAGRALEDRSAEVVELEREVDTLTSRRRQAEERWRLAEASGDAGGVRESRREVEALDELVASREEQLATLRFERVSIEDERRQELAEVERLDTRLEKVARWAWLRDIPLLGGFVPPVAVRQRLVGPEMPGGSGGGNVVMARPTRPGVPRTERCTTCHLVEERDDLAETNWSPPLRPHPRRDLFVAADSPHPVETFGCVVCHGGEGRSTDFVAAGHRPADERQAEDWSVRLGVSPGESDGGRSMLPAPMFEVGCGQCHVGTVVAAPVLAAAPRLVEGRRSIWRLGCEGCHAEGDASPRPWAPPLGSLASKLGAVSLEGRLENPATHPWIDDLFAPLADDATVEGSPEALAFAERSAIVSALWQHSRRLALDEPPAGDASRGEALYGKLGCAACHVSERLDALRTAVNAGAVDSRRLFGRSLAGVGERHPSWLFHWLLDPKGLEPESRKADPRLEIQEAADLTAFLLAPSAEPPAAETGLRPVDTALRDRLVLRELEAVETLETAAARLAAMGERERTLFLGERRIARRGCRGCHRLPGPADGMGTGDAEAPAEPLGAEDVVSLTEHSFEHRYPVFRLSKEEDLALRIALLADLGRGSGKGEDRRQVAGHRVERLGCAGCHAFGGVPGVLAGMAREPGEEAGVELAIPTLDGVGARLRPAWLTALLADPTGSEVHEGLAIRMPHYALDPGQVEELAGWFIDRSAVSWVDLDPPPPSEQQLALGRAAWELLQCDICHVDRPSYDAVARRLRAGWTVEWILNPRRHAAETRMPAVFAANEGAGPESTFLLASLETPMFATQYQRLRRVFDSDEELRERLGDPHEMAEALQAWMWQRSAAAEGRE